MVGVIQHISHPTFQHAQLLSHTTVIVTSERYTGFQFIMNQLNMHFLFVKKKHYFNTTNTVSDTQWWSGMLLGHSSNKCSMRKIHPNTSFGINNVNVRQPCFFILLKIIKHFSISKEMGLTRVFLEIISIAIRDC